VEGEALWRLVIETKYDCTRVGWCSKEVMRTFGVGVWKHIRRGWDKFSKFVRFEMGVGSRVSFSHDIWSGDQPLKISHPDLFSVALSKDVWVADNTQLQDGNLHWNVIFTQLV
jgi:hypothetical protein